MIKHPNYLIVHTSWYQKDIGKMIEITEKQLGVSKELNEGTWKLLVPGSLELAAGAKRYLKRFQSKFFLKKIEKIYSQVLKN